MLDSGVVKIKAIAFDKKGNILAESTSDSNIAIDSTPPITTLSVSDNGSFSTGNVIALSAKDNLSGVKEIEYRINKDSKWQLYTSPFIALNCNIYFQSEDNSGNIEPEKSQTVIFTQAFYSTVRLAWEKDYNPKVAGYAVFRKPLGEMIKRQPNKW